MQAGINAPMPVELRLHVLVMEFIGDDGVAAPRLRDACLPPERLRSVYTEMVVIMRTLYQTCRLVHADLSEYNILYYKVSEGQGAEVGQGALCDSGYCMSPVLISVCHDMPSSVTHV